MFTLNRLCFAAAMAASTTAAAQSAPLTFTPATLAERGLPIRADTLDGFVGDRNERGYFGFYVYAVSRATAGERNIYLVTMNYTGRANSSERNFQSDTLAIDAKTLAPLWRRFHARTDSASLTFRGRKATGWTHINSKYVKIDHELSPDAFDAGMNRWILASLPYAAGYQASWTSFSFWSNSETKSTAIVEGVEPVSIGGKTIDAWIVGNGRGTRRWVAKTTGAIVQVKTADGWEVKR